MIEILLLASCALTAPQTVVAPTLHNGAPFVSKVAVSPRNPDLIVVGYRSSSSGPIKGNVMARSLDGGLNFEAVAAPAALMDGQRITQLDFSRSGVLFVGNENKLFRSPDRGQTFDLVFEIVDGRINDIALDPFEGDRIVLAVRSFLTGSADVISTDGGDTWVSLPVPASVPQTSSTRTVTFDPVEPDRMLRLAFTRLVVSDGSGQTIVADESASGLDDDVALVDGRIIHVDSGFAGALEVSDDYGATFSTVPGVVRPLGAVIYNPYAPNQLVVDGERQRYASIDGGVSWASTGSGEFDQDAAAGGIAFVPSATSPLDVDLQTLVIGFNGGLSITPVGEDRLLGPALPAGPDQMRSVRVDPKNADRWISVEHDRRTFSNDRGLTWRHVAIPLDSTFKGLRARDDQSLVVYANCLGAFQTCWFDIMPDGTYTSGVGAPMPGFDTVDVRSEGRNLLATIDGGQTWILVDTLPPPGLLENRHSIGGCVRVLPTGVEILRQSYLIDFDGGSHVARWTSDFGATWDSIPTSGGLGTSTWNNVRPEVVYASDGVPTNPVQRSNDGGLTWFPVGAPTPSPEIVRGNLDPDLVVRSLVAPGLSQEGVDSAYDHELSRDGGMSWVSLGVVQGGFSDDAFGGKGSLAPDDSYLLIGPWKIDLATALGSPECVANPNSTGAPAAIAAIGTASVESDDVLLYATDLPPFTFGLFATSRDAGFVPNVAGSEGNLCLGGAIGRLDPMPLQASSTGVMTIRLDTAAMPQGNGPVPIQPGDTWRYELWFRDGQTSNRTNAVAIQFTR